MDLARVFEEVPKVGVATKFPPKLPQASRANGRKIRENLQILEILLNKRECVWVHVRQDRLALFKLTGHF